MEVPVVVGLYGGEREVFVLHLLESRPGESGEGSEADRAQDPVRVHVPNPRIDVITTGSHVLIRDRLEAIFLLGPAGDRIEPKSGRLLPFDLPIVGTVGALPPNPLAL